MDEKELALIERLANLQREKRNLQKALMSNALETMAVQKDLGEEWTPRKLFDKVSDDTDTLAFLQELPGFDLTAHSIAKAYPTIEKLKKAHRPQLLRLHRVGETKADLVIAYLSLYGIRIHP